LTINAQQITKWSTPTEEVQELFHLQEGARGDLGIKKNVGSWTLHGMLWNLRHPRVVKVVPFSIVVVLTERSVFRKKSNQYKKKRKMDPFSRYNARR